MKDRTTRRPRQEPTLAEAGSGPDALDIAAAGEPPEAPAAVEPYPPFPRGDETPVETAHPSSHAPLEASTSPDPSFNPIGPARPEPVEPSREELLWAEPSLQPGPLLAASGEREIHAGPLEPSQTGDIHPGPLHPAPDTDIHVGPLEPAYESDIRVGPLEHASTQEAPPGGDVHLLAEDRSAPSPAALAPAIVRRKKGWREQRWERRRRRIFFEEALAWVLVPIILVGCYLGVKGVLSALGTTPTALIQGIQTAISSRS